MEIKLNNIEISELLKLPKNFDSSLIDLEYGFYSKIFPLVSEKIILSISKSHPSIYEMLIKAGVLYSFVLEIPKIKVHISNTGINHFDQNKTKTAPWWDVRDLGLSWLKKADFYLISALKYLSQIDALKNEINFFKNSFPLIDFWQFSTVYHLNNSADAYTIVSKLLQEALEHFKAIFEHCDVDLFLKNEKLKPLILDYITNFALLKAIDSPLLIFLNSGIAVQYEELPWQKSVIATPEYLARLREQYQKAMDAILKRIYDFLNLNKKDFLCLSEDYRLNRTRIIIKKSSIWL